jgi:type IV secretion system protein VirB1
VGLLPLSLLAMLAATCAPQIAPATLAAIAQTESHLDPLAISDNTAHRSYRPKDKTEAVALARQLIGAGHSVDSGLMQINNANMKWLDLSIPDAFEPCASLAAGAKVLTSLSRYNSGSPTASIPYAVRVLAAAADLNSPRAQPTAVPRGGDFPSGSGAKPHEPHRWNAFPDPAEDSWTQ